MLQELEQSTTRETTKKEGRALSLLNKVIEKRRRDMHNNAEFSEDEGDVSAISSHHESFSSFSMEIKNINLRSPEPLKMNLFKPPKNLLENSPSPES